MTHPDTETLGNTIQVSSSKRSRRWCFTLNNYTQKEFDTITQAFSAKGFGYIIGKENSSTDTPHLQGYIEMRNAINFNTLKKILPRAHLEPTRGSKNDNIKYCSKEDPSPTTNLTIDVIMPTPEELYYKELESDYQNVIWNDWQQSILDLIKTEPNRRTINWFYEETGNIGKTFLTRFLDWKNRVIIVNGKQSDVFNGIKTYLDTTKTQPEIVIVDIPRTNENFVCYGSMEKIKDGLLYSGKYEGGTVRLTKLHLIVFANFHPDETKLSIDRWNIVKL